jgi:hypothetical protein
VTRPEQLWPGRVERIGYSYLVDRRHWVSETGQQWDAWPWPECDGSSFDDQTYMQTHLRGKGTFTADEKIRELIGDPQ